MQRIERYGVIALVFLLVTIVAVSLWGERKKTGGWFSFLGRDSKASRVDELVQAPTPDAPDGEEVGVRDLEDKAVPMSDVHWSGADSQAFAGPGEAPATHKDTLLVHQRPDVVAGESTTTGSIFEPPPLPEIKPDPAPAREYTIRSGDTLSQIAQRELGTKNRWREIVELNPGLDPARLSVGTKIRLSGGAPSTTVADKTVVEKPVVPQTEKAGSKKVAAAAGGRTYTVRSGDTLSRIAQRELGAGDRWRELIDLNPGLDPARLHVGRVLRLPGGEAPRDTRDTRVARAETDQPSAPKAESAKPRSKVR